MLVPGADWMIVSGMAGAGSTAGRLYLIDAGEKGWRTLAPDVGGKARAPYAACPSAPDMTKFAAHGLALLPGKGGRHTLLAVNHGGRESIEAFEVTGGRGEPEVRWIGCVILPKDVVPNSVAALPGGGFIVSKFNEAGDADAFAHMAKLEKTGVLIEWTPKGGFRRLAGTELSGDNGVAVSPDGRWVFVNAWPEMRVLRFPRSGGGKPVSVKVDFLPDNLRWAPDGKLLVAGQVAASMADLLACAQPCAHDWAVLKLDPNTMKVTPVLREKGTRAFSDATGALQVGNELWIGTFRGDRLAYTSLK